MQPCTEVSALLEPGLVRRVVLRQRAQRRQVTAGRAAGQDQEARVGAVLRTVLAHPGDRPLHVDQVVGLGRPRRQPVVGGEADPALLGQVQHQRPALLLLVADHPAAAVHLQQGRAFTGRCFGDEDVELVAPRSSAYGTSTIRSTSGSLKAIGTKKRRSQARRVLLRLARLDPLAQSLRRRRARPARPATPSARGQQGQQQQPPARSTRTRGAPPAPRSPRAARRARQTAAAPARRSARPRRRTA